MKKFLLINVLLGIFNLCNAQQTYTFKSGIKTTTLSVNSTQNSPSKIIYPENLSHPTDVNIVNIIDIGTSVNVYDFAANLRSLWVDPELNTISFYHRMGGALDPDGNAGDLGYDISTDGGITWNTMIRNFYFGDMVGSNPHHGIYNPEGNDDPENAYVVYNLSGANQQSSGFVHGVSNIGDTSYHIQDFDSTNAYGDYNPSAFTINSQGNVFIVTPMFNDFEYLDSLIITKGVWNESLQNLEYSNSKIEAIFADELSGPIDIKIAFGADGEVGYITTLGNNGMAEQVEGFTNYYPIYWKTTDGGETWAGPEFIQMDGDTGLIGIVNHLLTDQQISELFEGDMPPRREISYTTAFDHDITVDNNDLLHIAVVIGPSGSDPYSIITESGYIYAMDIHSQNSSAKYCTAKMGSMYTFEGTFGEYTEYNRIHITKNQNGDKVFISWLDTDIEDAENNNQPNIWCRGYEPSTTIKTPNSSGEDAPTNVTLFSGGMWASFFGTSSNMAFENEDGWTIPFVFVFFENEDFTGPVQYKYITDFSFNESDFTPELKEYTFCGNLVGTEEKLISNISISQNSPNPFHNQTTFNINLTNNSDVIMEVYSVDGKLVTSNNYDNLPSGKNQIIFKTNGLKSGIYLYTFDINGEKTSGKMIIK